MLTHILSCLGLTLLLQCPSSLGVSLSFAMCAGGGNVLANLHCTECGGQASEQADKGPPFNGAAPGETQPPPPPPPPPVDPPGRETSSCCMLLCTCGKWSYFLLCTRSPATGGQSVRLKWREKFMCTAAA
jgi:hypothetical protein